MLHMHPAGLPSRLSHSDIQYPCIAFAHLPRLASISHESDRYYIQSRANGNRVGALI